MSNQNDKIIKELDFESLVNTNYKFRIPLYQRKYAWSADEVNTLLDDLSTFKNKIEKGNDKYFIGNIVVEQKEDGFYDVIDGQQRLTTLYLIAKIASCDNIFELSYEIRPEDDVFLKDFKNEDKKSKADGQFRENIEAILKYQKEHLGDGNPTLHELLHLCKIALTNLPQGIDIVKYFEVMNNRGKQLEKHQILKANLLNSIKSNETNCQGVETNYAKIWNYCSNMEVYIEDSIYYGDLKDDEKNIEQNARKPLLDFLKSNKKLPKVFKANTTNCNHISILDILNPYRTNEPEEKEEFYVRQEYGSIVKFPIFLIQVLKIFLATQTENKIENSVGINDIVVNDRYLLDYFYKIDEHKEKTKEFLFDCQQSKEFIEFLLKMRILYDYYIFKRDDKGEPFLDKADQYKVTETQELKRILMLQLLFNFSAPQYFAQDWLSVALKWLNGKFQEDFTLLATDFYKEYFDFIENFDKQMAMARLNNLSLIGTINNYLVNGKFKDVECKKECINFVFLNNGTATPHYWFYKLDYLLWKECGKDKSDIWNLENGSKFKENDRFKYSTIKSNFRLSRLNSVEHIYPQSKCKDWEEHNIDKCTNVDRFGNLSLISNHMNSALKAQEGQNKREDIQKQVNNGTIESLKMILAYSKYSEWNQNNCNDHQTKMINILKNDLAVML